MEWKFRKVKSFMWSKLNCLCFTKSWCPPKTITRHRKGCKPSWIVAIWQVKVSVAVEGLYHNSNHAPTAVNRVIPGQGHFAVVLTEARLE